MTEKVSFDSLQMKIPLVIKNLPIDQQREIFEYLNGLDEINRKAYEIAFDHLGSSFNIHRSNGFKEWKHSKIN